MSAVISSNSPTNTIPSLPTTLQGPRSFINLTHSGTTTTTTTNNAMRASPPVPQRYQPPNPIDPPTGISYAAFLRTWNDDHVLKWLTEIKCASHYDAFTTNEIKGDVLLELDQTTLKEMGITSIGDRLRIINAVKVLRQRVAASRASVAPLSIHKNNNSVDFSYNPPKSESSNTKNVNRRLENVRPPALQLNPNTRSADLPSVLRDQPDSARTVVHPHNTTIIVPNGPSTSNSNISLASSIRPLPQPTPITSSTPPSNPPSTITSTGTPSSAHTPGSVRPVLPPLPPPPRGQPPLPPGATRVGAGRNLPPSSGEPPVYQPPPPPGSTATAQNGTATPTTTGTPRTAHLPADPRPGNVGGQKFGLGIGPAARSISPIPPTRVRPAVSPGPGSTHNRMGSTSANVNGGAPTKGLPGRPGANNNTNTATPAASNHPYATAGAAILSPIDEAFPSSSQGPQSTTSSFSVGKGPFPATPNPQGGSGSPNNGSAANGVTNPSLTDLRRKLVKFVLPEQEQGFGPGVGLSFTIDVAACAGGVEVLERVLRKFGSSGIGKEGSVLQVGQTDEGGLVVDGYGVFLDRNAVVPLTEAELLSICHAPDHPTRDGGLALRRIPTATTTAALPINQSSKTKRASSISILSGLGVRDPERALEPPPSPSGKSFMSYTSNASSSTRGSTGASPMSSMTTIGGSSSPSSPNAKRPSKLRNFFGQRPPSELITTHLTEYFPNAEKKVLARTARNSVYRKRDSIASSVFNQHGHTSRASTATIPPPVPDKNGGLLGVDDNIPRMSLSTEDGKSVDLVPYADGYRTAPSASSGSNGRRGYRENHQLPPIPFPTESFSASMEDLTTPTVATHPQHSNSAAANGRDGVRQLPSTHQYAASPPAQYLHYNPSSLQTGQLGTPTGSQPLPAPPRTKRMSRTMSIQSKRQSYGHYGAATAAGAAYRNAAGSPARNSEVIDGADGSGYNYLSELRSSANRKDLGKDRSDTASLMTVDEITANVESRRASRAYRAAQREREREREREKMMDSKDSDLDEWTKVDTDMEGDVPKAVAPDGRDEDLEEEVGGGVRSDSDLDDTDPHGVMLSDDEDEDGVGGVGSDEEDVVDVDDEDESDVDSEGAEDEELSLDVDEDGQIRNVMNARKANKWIKGALIGAGSFGKVYLGMDASSGLLMAVKQVELPTGSGPNQERKKSMLNALEREIELLKNLQHENIVQYLYSSIDEEFLNIFLEYVPGGSVTALLRSYGAFEEPLVRNFVRQILQGLNYLHERDIIHRDIKGANMLVDNKGGIKISDFGISKKVDDISLTGNRINRPSLQGSVFWMAPEVVKQTGHTRKADIWSLGCLVVEMFTGEHPWAQLTQMQAIFKIGSSARPTIPSDISPEAQDFLRKTFEINHELRPSADELLNHPWITGANSE